jgi:hypothetical protein
MSTVAAASAGAGLAYLFDPDQGRARRARLRDRTLAVARRERRALHRRARYERGRLEGFRHRRGRSHEPITDTVLVDIVRSEVLGRRPAVAGRVSVDAFGGVVTLRGQLDDRADIESLEQAVAAVDGVHRVENLLHGPGEPAPNKAEARRYRPLSAPGGAVSPSLGAQGASGRLTR